MYPYEKIGQPEHSPEDLSENFGFSDLGIVMELLFKIFKVVIPNLLIQNCPLLT